MEEILFTFSLSIVASVVPTTYANGWIKTKNGNEPDGLVFHPKQ